MILLLLSSDLLHSLLQISSSKLLMWSESLYHCISICNEPSEPIKQSPLLTDEDRNTSTEANVKAKHVFWKIKIDYDGMHGICNIQQIFCWWLLVNNQYYWLMSWKRGLWLVVWVNTRCFLSRLSLNQHMTLVMVTRSHGYPELWSCENCEDVKETAEYMLY